MMTDASPGREKSGRKWHPDRVRARGCSEGGGDLGAQLAQHWRTSRFNQIVVPRGPGLGLVPQRTRFVLRRHHWPKQRGPSCSSMSRGDNNWVDADVSAHSLHCSSRTNHSAIIRDSHSQRRS